MSLHVAVQLHEVQRAQEPLDYLPLDSRGFKGPKFTRNSFRLRSRRTRVRLLRPASARPDTWLCRSMRCSARKLPAQQLIASSESLPAGKRPLHCCTHSSARRHTFAVILSGLIGFGRLVGKPLPAGNSLLHCCAHSSAAWQADGAQGWV